LFEDLRAYAYKRVLKFKQDLNYEAWERDLLSVAIDLNCRCNALNLLQYNEIKATARSVSRWTWKNFDSATFSKIQSKRGKRNLGKTKKTSAKSKIDNILELLK